jgi:molybdopterin-guanine dinucleotide biosynthesis protein A
MDPSSAGTRCPLLISFDRTMTGTSVAAAILAGGKARRLGGAVKSTLVLDGVRIIDRQIAALRKVADPIFIVAPDPEPFASLGLAVLTDIVPDCGALGGIYTAIVKSPRPRTLVVAGDLPFLSAALLERLVQPGDADLVVPRGPRGYEPLCAVYSAACAEPIRRRLEKGALKAAVLPEGVRVEEIGPEALAAYDPDGLLFVNVNAPHDYERARDLIESLPQRRGDGITDKHSPS